jgi:PleD family two-component response regulator
VEALGIPHLASPAGRVTISAGVAVMDRDSHATPGDLLGESDRALYTAKNDGRNRVREASSVRVLPLAS